ncbi:hypothetical protein [Dongia sp.]
MDAGGLDFQEIAMIGGFFAAGFAAVWIFLTLRQSEKPKSDGSEDGGR